MKRYSRTAMILMASLATTTGCKHHTQGPVPVVSAPLPVAIAPDATPIPGSDLHASSPYGVIRPYIPTEPKLDPPPIEKKEVAILPAPKEGPALLPVPSLASDNPPILPPKDLVKLPEPKPETPNRDKTIAQGPTLPEPKPVMVIPNPQPSGSELSKTETSPRIEAPKADSFVAAPTIPTPPLTPQIIRAPVEGSDTKPSPASFVLPLKAGETYGKSGDYRWVAGVLDRHHKGNFWTLRYVDFASDDRWGGKVRLVDAEKLKGFHDGDVLYIEGELLAPNNASAAADSNPFPPYRVSEVRLIRRGQ